MQLRKHQAQTLEVCNRIVAGAPARDVFGLVTPGGGKSLMPIIAAKTLIGAGLADAICWVVPRNSLQHQAESNFVDPFFRKALNHRLAIRTSTNEPDPCRGLDGFVTTYQALGIDYQRTALEDFKRRRYILFLDEFHHCEEYDAWHKAIAPLVGAAAFRFFVTGTLERGNAKRIAWVPYRIQKATPEFVEQTPDLDSDTPERFVIRYTRSDALAQQAILPIHFFFNDAKVKWMTNTGHIVHYESLQGIDQGDHTAALYTALSTDYADELLDYCTGHWLKYKTTMNALAKMLVVTSSYELARRAVNYLSNKWGAHSSEIATSHNPEHAAKSIQRFKAGSIDILVTIAMAYEGLDVPAVSHIACLTHIRSTPWIEQMLARAVRVNRDPQAGPYQSQIAYVFAPHDDLFMEVVSKIEKEQAPAVRQMSAPEQLNLFDSSDADAQPQGAGGMPAFIPLEGCITRRLELFNGPKPAPVFSPETPSDIEGRLLSSIETHVRRYAMDNFYTPKKINSEISARFGKKRREMTIQELEAVLRHIKRVYPVNAFASVKATPAGCSPPRPVKRKFSTAAQPWPGN